MSTLVEAVSVVIPRHVLDVSYPGGSDAYLEGARRTAGVRFVIADGRLTSVSLPTLDDAARFVRPLESVGLAGTDGRPIAIACVDEHFGPTGSAPWLRWRRHDDGYTSCWLEWTEPGELTVPDDWVVPARAAGRVSGHTSTVSHAARHGDGDVHDAHVATLVADAPGQPDVDPFEETSFEATSFEGPTFEETSFDDAAYDEALFGDGSLGDATFDAPAFGAAMPFAPPPLDPSLEPDAEPEPEPRATADAAMHDELHDAAMHDAAMHDATTPDALPHLASHDENGVRCAADVEPAPTVVPPIQPEAAPVTLTLAAPHLDAPATADAVPALVDVVRQALDRRGWRHSLDDGQRSFFYQVAGARASYPGSAVLDDDGLARVYTHLPVRVPEHRRAEAVELLTRANHGLPSGNFEFDYRDGEVRFKASADASDGLAPEAADRLLQLGLAACDRVHDPLMQVIYGGVSAVVAMGQQG